MTVACVRALALAACLVCLAPACARAAACVRDGGHEVVVGLSVGTSLMERDAADGLRAAIREAQLLTVINLTVRQLNHTNEEDLKKNIRALVDDHCAFMIAGRIGNSTTEQLVLADLKNRSVPLVGALTATEDLHNASKYTAVFPRSGGGTTTLPLIANVRASGGDELFHIVAMLARDWEMLQRVSLVWQKTAFGLWANRSVDKVVGFLLGENRSLVSNYMVVGERLSDDDLRQAGQDLFEKPEQPRALILCIGPKTALQFLVWLSRSGHEQLSVFLPSWASASDLAVSLDATTRALLAQRRISVHFTQTMPDPAPRDVDSSPSLLRRFAVADVPRRTHDALEGYLSGWFIYEVAQHAVARDGLPLTRESFLRAAFVGVRTFSVQGVALGPYGDGGISGDRTSMQSGSDGCNQGMHEVFLTRFDLANGSLTHLPGSSMKFAGCTTPRVAQRDELTILGSVMPSDSDDERTARAGLLATVMLHDSQGTDSAALKTALGSLGDAARLFGSNSQVAALLRPSVDSPSSVTQEVLRQFAVVSPTPGFFGLRRPFDRRIVNVFPSSYDEMEAAEKFFGNKTTVAVFANDDSAYTKECLERVTRTDSALGFKQVDAAEAQKILLGERSGHGGLLVLGGKLDLSRLDSPATVLLNSQVAVVSAGAPGARSSGFLRLSVSPPMSYFPTTSALRTEYSTWVASADMSEASFQSFLVGKFMSLVIHSAKESHPRLTLSSDDLVDEVYKGSVWTLAQGVELGPFKSGCSGGDRRDCCNQGLDTVYVVDGRTQKVVQAFEHVGDCGRKYMAVPAPASRSGLSRELGLGLGIGLGAALVVATAVLSIAVWRSRRTIEFLNIRKGEIELGKCLGNGRLGSLYLADWHGTAVAVRVIEKRATPKEDQRVIKEEVLLLSRHHHPNVLLLLGFCETPSEIMVVTEYLEGGTLADYIRREKSTSSVFTLISMAFDVLKGIAYLHSCKPPIVHGSINKNNLLIDAKGTVKVSDFWVSTRNSAPAPQSKVRSVRRASWLAPEVISCTFLTPATDVYAFGVVLWELVSPLDAAEAPLGSCSGSDASPDSSACAQGAEMHTTQLGPPEIPPNLPTEVAELLKQCWRTQPERRPSVFQILRNWPSTFASFGAFEVPQDLNSTASGAMQLVECDATRWRTDSRAPAVVANDDIAASMLSIMPQRADSVALQTPDGHGLSAASQLAVLHDGSFAAPIEPPRSPRVTS
eukprot:m51a1_g8686 putative pas domain-containing protein tyrosine kinase (1222) ;mRNA; r:11101-15418